MTGTAAPSNPTTARLGQRLGAEALGTAFLLAAVVGSGIMGDRLSGGNVAIALLANTIATGAALVALILTFGPLSGAHLNPLVSIVGASQRRLPWSDAGAYVGVQCLGAAIGVGAANLMFGEPVYAWSHHERSGLAQMLSEFIATFGLVAVVWIVSRTRPAMAPFAVGAYITSAYWFTASTSFANPAVTLARTITDTFAGIRPADAPGFIAAQVIGAAAAATLLRWMAPTHATTTTPQSAAQSRR